MLKKKRGQSAVEYALVIIVAIAALLAINAYMKKGMQGRLKESTDQIGRQFDPKGNYEYSWKTQSTGTTNTTENRIAGNGSITQIVGGSENVFRSEYEAFGNVVSQKY